MTDSDSDPSLSSVESSSSASSDDMVDGFVSTSSEASDDGPSESSEGEEETSSSSSGSSSSSSSSAHGDMAQADDDDDDDEDEDEDDESKSKKTLMYQLVHASALQLLAVFARLGLRLERAVINVTFRIMLKIALLPFPFTIYPILPGLLLALVMAPLSVAFLGYVEEDREFYGLGLGVWTYLIGVCSLLMVIASFIVSVHRTALWLAFRKTDVYFVFGNMSTDYCVTMVIVMCAVVFNVTLPLIETYRDVVALDGDNIERVNQFLIGLFVLFFGSIVVRVISKLVALKWRNDVAQPLAKKIRTYSQLMAWLLFHSPLYVVAGQDDPVDVLQRVLEGEDLPADVELRLKAERRTMLMLNQTYEIVDGMMHKHSTRDVARRIARDILWNFRALRKPAPPTGKPPRRDPYLKLIDKQIAAAAEETSSTTDDDAPLGEDYRKVFARNAYGLPVIGTDEAAALCVKDVLATLPNNRLRAAFKEMVGMHRDMEYVPEAALVKGVQSYVAQRRGWESIVGSTDSMGDAFCLATRVVWYVLGVVLFLFIIGFDVLGLGVSLVGFFLGLSFIFGETIRAAFRGLLLHIYLRPFTVGDLVVCPAACGGNAIQISGVSLFATEGVAANGEVWVVPNETLLSNNLSLWSSSTANSVDLYFSIAGKTTPEQLNQFRIAIRDWMEADATHPWELEDGEYWFVVTNFLSGAYIDLNLWVGLENVSWENQELSRSARNALTMAVTAIALDMGIQRSLPDQGIIFKSPLTMESGGDAPSIAGSDDGDDE